MEIPIAMESDTPGEERDRPGHGKHGDDAAASAYPTSTRLPNAVREAKRERKNRGRVLKVDAAGEYTGTPTSRVYRERRRMYKAIPSGGAIRSSPVGCAPMVVGAARGAPTSVRAIIRPANSGPTVVMWARHPADAKGLLEDNQILILRPQKSPPEPVSGHRGCGAQQKMIAKSGEPEKRRDRPVAVLVVGWLACARCVRCRACVTEQGGPAPNVMNSCWSPRGARPAVGPASGPARSRRLHLKGAARAVDVGSGNVEGYMPDDRDHKGYRPMRRIACFSG